MKTLGRILIILFVTSLLAGAMYAAVSAGSGLASTGQSGPGFGPQGERGERPEGFGEGHEGGGSWLGVLSNLAVIGALVAAVVLVRRLLRPRPALSVQR